MERGSILHRALSFTLALALGTTLIRTGQANAQEASAVHAIAIAAGEYHSLALKADGKVIAWGNNTYGQTSVPAGLADIVEVSAGANHSLALKADGTVVSWGNNYFGQTDVPEGLREVTAISAGANFSLALKADGSIVAWGSDLVYETRVPSSLSGTAKLVAGRGHSLALGADGRVVAWGLGDNNRTQVPASLKRSIAVAAGKAHSMALQADGTIVAWGYNGNQQTAVPAGLGKAVEIAAGGTHSLALLANGAVEAWGSDTYGQATVPPDAKSGVKAIAAGEFHSLALKADGTIVTWGYPYYGLMEVPMDTPSFIKAIDVSAGRYHSLALLANGAVEAWGLDEYGQTNVPSDAKSGVKAIAAGAFHSLALKADGTVVAWGDDSEGQASVPPGLNGVKAIAAGAYHSLALKADGSIVAWGDPSRDQANVPADLDEATAIAAGEYHSLALRADGTVAAWGTVYFEGTTATPSVPAGLDGVTSIASGAVGAYVRKADGKLERWTWTEPDATIVSSGTIAVSSTFHHALVLKADGRVLIIIESALGAEADPPANLKQIVAVSAGDYHSLALKADGSILAWGLSSFGQSDVPGDSALTDLTMQEGAFAEAFSSSVTSYTYSYIGPSATHVKINAVLADPTHADLYIDGQRQASGGGVAQVVIAGVHMTGQTIQVSLGESATFEAQVIEDTRATAAVTISPNLASTEKAYRLAVLVNGMRVSGLFATLVVAGRSSGTVGGSGQLPQREAEAEIVIDKNGVLVNPDTLDITKPTVVLDVVPNRDGMAYVNIPARIMNNFKKQNAELTFEIKAPFGSYRIPVNLPSLILGLDELAAAHKLEADDIGFKMTLSDKSDTKDAKAAFDESFPGALALGPFVDFHIDILDGRTGQTIGTADRFSEALVRTIPVSDDTYMGSDRWGAFRLHEKTGVFEFVPARIVRSGPFTGVEIRSYSNSMYAIARRGASFDDIGSHWGRRYILQAADKGLVNGDRTGRFSPDKPVTRAEFAAMLVRALGRGDPFGSASPYDDVRSGSWYYGSVTRARELDLLGFASGEHFLPHRSLTREEMASVLAAAVRTEQRAVAAEFPSLDAYRDIEQINPVYLEDIRQLVRLNLMKGTTDRSFSPKGEVTRAQAAAVLIRTLQSLEWID